ncbi:MAG: peptidoglycan bridge formation glycyltransferase FemA/FemB family protein [Clostridia bacterium]|nr:peptidoglycan bridge formation glycyltransferase FemA/FemB family protein [Clostridia bacterium]
MIEIVDIDHAAEIDAFVRAHEKCHFEQTSSWGRVKNYSDWVGLICRDERGAIKGVMSILVSKVNHTNMTRLYAPRGPLFDEADLDTFRALIDAAKKLAKKYNAMVLKIDPMIPNENEVFLSLTKEMGFSVNTAADFSLSNPRVAYVTDLSGIHTHEELFAIYHRTMKGHIRKAEKTLTLRMGTENDLPDFIEMMKQTGEKNGFHPHSMQYYKAFINDLEGASFWIAEEDGLPAAATFAVELGNRMWYMYGCSFRDRLKNHPNEFLQWKMQCHAVDQGYRYFDLRGVEGFPDPENPHYGLHRYKQSLGSTFVCYCGEFYYVYKPLAYKALNLIHK